MMVNNQTAAASARSDPQLAEDTAEAIPLAFEKTGNDHGVVSAMHAVIVSTGYEPARINLEDL
jgi:hypothetical protein